MLKVGNVIFALVWLVVVGTTSWSVGGIWELGLAYGATGVLISALSNGSWRLVFAWLPAILSTRVYEWSRSGADGVVLGNRRDEWFK